MRYHHKFSRVIDLSGNVIFDVYNILYTLISVLIMCTTRYLIVITNNEMSF
jgi:hypothetical protein